ncbi:MAG: NAD(P)H-dependent oxidoreductase [Actinomycetia bacterium]|nr:NAD(P)H-dependent oxidoreductase [Actinomycetes bacterium]
MPKLLVVVTSTRPGRIAPVIADWFVSRAKEHGGFDVAVADLAELNLPMMDEPNHPRARQYVHEHTKNWSATVASADAFVFVTPEYNYTFTAPLKNALDYLSLEWAYKPVGFVSYGGASGGLRAVQSLKPVVTTLSMFPLAMGVALPFAMNQIVEGELRPVAPAEESARSMLDELAKVAVAMAPLRQ